MEKLEKTVSIAMLQISSIVGDIEANMQKVLCFLDSQLPENVDILVLPEVWTVGWACEKFIESAQSFPESKVISFLADIAKKYSINVFIMQYTDSVKHLLSAQQTAGTVIYL